MQAVHAGDDKNSAEIKGDETIMNARKINTGEKRAARFIFYPKLREIAKKDNCYLLNIADIGQELGFDVDLTKRMEKYLIDEKLVKLSDDYSRIICSIGQEEKEIAHTSLPRIVTEIRDRTVFAIFDNKKLKSELERWCIKNNCEICWGAPQSPDIIAIPYFVSVIDRDVLGAEEWEMYLGFWNYDEYVAEYQITEVCIIVDDKRDVELPRYNQVICFDLRYDESIRWIINAVDMAKKMERTKQELMR